MPDKQIALPDIGEPQTLLDLVRNLTTYLTRIIDAPQSFEQLRHSVILRPIVDHLSRECADRQIISALLISKWHFSTLGADDDMGGLHHTRSLACEIIAWRFLNSISNRDALDYLLSELSNSADELVSRQPSIDINPEEARLISNEIGLPARTQRSRLFLRQSRNDTLEADSSNIPSKFAGRNALEIAAVAEARKFLSQKSVQQIIQEIWRGEIVFWDTLGPSSQKRAKRYNKKKTDLYARLRVPRYHKIFEALFFLIFITLYYAVLIERNTSITVTEIFFWIWTASFIYEEYGEFRDAGQLLYTGESFYQTYVEPADADPGLADLWNLTDMCIMAIATAFVITRIIGLAENSESIKQTAFDILSLQALFLIPRLFALLSVHPYFGVLIPCLKEMTRDFIKFLSVVIILYLGFLSTFHMLARDVFTLKQISWSLVYVFFGSSSLGFDIASEISPSLGPPLMIAFVTVTNILLITSLISLLTNTLMKVLDHAREEYLFQYSVFVLEASALRRLTYYSPPLNLVSLLVFRPLRLFLPREDLLHARITLLKITHWPFVAIIFLFEAIAKPLSGDVESTWSHSKSPSSAHTYFASEVETARIIASSSSLGGTSAAVPSPFGAREPAQLSNETELRFMIGKLSAQIEELSRRLDEKRENDA